MSFLRNLSLLALVSLTACVPSPSVAKTTPVEVWRVGDDALTSRFRDELESAFRAAPEFSLSSGKVPGTLVVTIPTHVAWREIGGETEVSYSINFTGPAGEALGESVGRCLEHRLEDCVTHVLKDARSVRLKLRR